MWRLALVGLLMLALVALEDQEPPLPSQQALPPVVPPLPDVPSDVWAIRGKIVEQENYGFFPEDAASFLGKAWRAEYMSVSGLDGGARKVSGAFFIPAGTPPAGGWPVVSFGHGTTGIGHECGPSWQPDMQGYGWLVESLLEEKYAVALTDYEGLGQTGLHPYLEPRTAAFNIIDAARALRQLAPSVSKRWVAAGYSQGGPAAWAANELDSYYGEGLELEGTVALAPAANLSGVAPLVWTGSMTGGERSLFPTVLTGIARYIPELDARAFLHASTKSYQRQFSACEQNTEKTVEEEFFAPVPWSPLVDRVADANDVKPKDTDDIEALQRALRQIAVPQSALSAPMLVISGEQDPVVLPDGVRYSVSLSCALGGQVELLMVPDADHNILKPAVGRVVNRWIAQRFAGVPAPTNCAAPVSGDG